MRNWAEMYQRKLVSAEEAVKVIKSGDWVDYGWVTGHPVALDEALARAEAVIEGALAERKENGR